MFLGCYKGDGKPEIDPTLQTDPEISGPNYYLMAGELGGFQRHYQRQSK